MNYGERYFEKRELLIKLLNERKDENGISKITRTEIEKELNISTTNINQTIREINSHETVIERYENFYKVKVNNLYEIPKYRRIKEIEKELLIDIEKMNGNENNIAKEFNISRNELRQIKTIIKTTSK